MRFSLFFFAAAADPRQAAKYRLLLESAKFADGHLFDAIWTPERHFQVFGGLYPNPSLTSAALAVVTERIRLRAGSVVLPLHEPIRIAEEFAVVDNLSGGRVEISMARGWHPDDFVIRPEAFEDSERRLNEGIDVVQRLWRGESIRRPNGLGQEIDVRIYPQPVQSELVVWRTCQRKESVAWAGSQGHPVLTAMLYENEASAKEKFAGYRRALSDAGRSGTLALMVHTFVGGDARQHAWPAYRDYLEQNLVLQQSFMRARGDDSLDSITEDDKEAMFRRAFDHLVEGHGLIGTPEECLPTVHALSEMGVDELACLIDFGIGTDVVLDSLPELARLSELSRDI